MLKPPVNPMKSKNSSNTPESVSKPGDTQTGSWYPVKQSFTWNQTSLECSTTSRNKFPPDLKKFGLSFSVTVKVFWYLIISEGKLIPQPARWLCHAALTPVQCLAICIPLQMDLSLKLFRIELFPPPILIPPLFIQCSSEFNNQIAQLSPY